MAESGRAPACKDGANMITAPQCRTYAMEWQLLGMRTEISVQRATILVAMSRSWTTLANQLERYDAIVKEERN